MFEQRRRVLSGFACCVTALIVAAVWFALNASGQRSEVVADERWEYLVVALGNTSLTATPSPGERKQKVFQAEASAVERNLDVLGEEGWELVSVAGTPTQPAFFLKRPSRKK